MRVTRVYSYGPKPKERENTRARIITPLFQPPVPRRATTINLWRVMAQAGFCLNGQPCNSWTRVTAGTDAPGIQARIRQPSPATIFREDATRNDVPSPGVRRARDCSSALYAVLRFI